VGFFFLRRDPRNFENVTSARRVVLFLGFLAIVLVAEIPQKEVFKYARIHSLLVNGMVTASSLAL